MSDIRPPIGPPRTEQNRKALAALAAAARRNLPPGYDAESFAESLVRAPDGAIVDKDVLLAMQRGIYANAQNARGINEADLDSRRAKNPIPFFSVAPGSVADILVNNPGMELGPGDQKNYQALRDSNLLNAALGLGQVATIDDLRAGHTHNGSADPTKPNPLSPMTWLAGTEVTRQKKRYDHLDDTVRDWSRAEQDPSQWGNAIGSNYAQHAWVGRGVPMFHNVKENNGGTFWGDGLAWMDRWNEGGNRAMTMPDKTPKSPVMDGLIDDDLKGVAKWLGGAWQGAEEERLHQQAKWAVGRGSPLLPGDMQPGSPNANGKIGFLKSLVEDTRRPSNDEHASSRGETLTPIGRAWRDNRFAPFDPLTAASVAFSGGAALAGLGAKAFLPAVMREVVSEGTQPLNWAGVLSSLGTPEFQPVTAEQYQERRDQAERAFQKIPKAMEPYGKY